MEDTLLVQRPEGRRLAVCQLVVLGRHPGSRGDAQEALLGWLVGDDQPGFDQLGLDPLGVERLRS